MHFFDFTDAGFGLLVKRSAHQRQQHFVPQDAPDVFGIMVGRDFNDEEGRAVCYPRVHWEGEVNDTACHPANVEPVRPHALPVITVL